MSGFLNAAAPRAHFERYLVPQETRRLLATLRKRRGKIARRDSCWIRVGMFSGFRVGNLAGLTVGDARRAITGDKLRANAAHAKRGHGYDVPMSTGLRRALREALAVRRAMGYDLDDADAPLFVSREGAALSVRSMQHQLKFWRTEAGIATPVSPHWLRHTFAKRVHGRTTHNDAQGVVQALLGQRSRNASVIYTLPDRDTLAEAAEAACR